MNDNIVDVESWMTVWFRGIQHLRSNIWIVEVLLQIAISCEAGQTDVLLLLESWYR